MIPEKAGIEVRLGYFYNKVNRKRKERNGSGMKKIVLLCAAGMSTGMLVIKMRDAAKEMGYDCEINAYAVAEADEVGKDADIILLGPQIQFQLERVKKICPGKIVELINIQDYGMLNGKNVMKHVKEQIG